VWTRRSFLSTSEDAPAWAKRDYPGYVFFILLGWMIAFAVVMVVVSDRVPAAAMRPILVVGFAAQLRALAWLLPRFARDETPLEPEPAPPQRSMRSTLRIVAGVAATAVALELVAAMNHRGGKDRTTPAATVCMDDVRRQIGSSGAQLTKATEVDTGDRLGAGRGVVFEVTGWVRNGRRAGVWKCTATKASDGWTADATVIE